MGVGILVSTSSPGADRRRPSPLPLLPRRLFPLRVSNAAGSVCVEGVRDGSARDAVLSLFRGSMDGADLLLEVTKSRVILMSYSAPLPPMFLIITLLLSPGRPGARLTATLGWECFRPGCLRRWFGGEIVGFVFISLSSWASVALTCIVPLYIVRVFSIW